MNLSVCLSVSFFVFPTVDNLPIHLFICQSLSISFLSKQSNHWLQCIFCSCQIRICLSISWSLCLSVFLSAQLLSVCVFICLSVLSICQSVSISFLSKQSNHWLQCIFCSCQIRNCLSICQSLFWPFCLSNCCLSTYSSVHLSCPSVNRCPSVSLSNWSIQWLQCIYSL